MPRLIICLLLALPSLILAAPFPTPFTAHYSVAKGSLPLGEMTRSLQSGNDGQWIFESVTHATGLAAVFLPDDITERSVWTYADGHIESLRYIYHNPGGKQKRELDLSFDSQNHIVSNAVEGYTWQLPTPPRVYDKLNYQLALMLDVQQGKTELEYSIADHDKIKTYRFAIVGEEELTTPLGVLRTVKITRVQDSDERTTRVWCAPSLDYLPVKIEQVDKGEGEFSMLIETLERPSPDNGGR